MRGKGLIFCAVPALVAVLFAGQVWASGFQLWEQNASGIGNSYAGSAAVAENASTVFFNPAGMTQLQAREISIGAVGVKPSLKFSNHDSTTPTAFTGGVKVAATGNDGGDAGGWNLVPDGYFSWALSRDLYLGIGLSAPFGLATEYDSNWYGRYQAVKFSVDTYNVNPSMAYRLSDKLSIGFGVNWQRMKAEYIRQATPLMAPPTGQVKLSADDDAWGWNMGVLLQAAPSTRIGLSYRSKIKHTLEGDLTGLGGALNKSAKADITLPDTAILSIVQGLTDRWELLGDISWTGWSSVDTIDIIADNTPPPAQTLEPKFKNTWRVALGTNYKLSDAWKLKFGLAYDQSPVPDAQHRLTSLPDNDRTWISAGTQWKPTKTSALDLGAAYLYMKDSDIDNNQNPARGIVNGSYKTNVIIIGAQYSLGF